MDIYPILIYTDGGKSAGGRAGCAGGPEKGSGGSVKAAPFRIIWPLLCLLAALAGCGPAEAPEDADTDWTPLQMARAVRDSQAEPAGMTALLPGDGVYEAYLAEGYGLAPEEVEDGAVLASGGASAREIAVLRLAEGADPEGAAEALRAYLEERLGAFTGYLPEEEALLADGQVAVKGRYLALLVCPDGAAALAAFEDCFTQPPPAEPPGEEPSAAAPASTPEPAPEAAETPVPAGTPEPGPELMAEGATSGTCGDNLTWSLDVSTGVLTISGTGEMADWHWSVETRQPWYANLSSIKKVVVGPGVTSIGSYAFDGASHILEAEMADSITRIGALAFRGCTQLAEVRLPAGINMRTGVFLDMDR